jgi:RNA polymerase sigma factor (TIGR02999 family)
MPAVTQILNEIDRGSPEATEQLLPLVYDELKKLAASKMLAERSDHTLQATALVHEAYLRLVSARQVQRWESRGHFFSAAAEAMRRILVEHARRRASQKCGGNRQRLDAEQLAIAPLVDPDLLIDIDCCITRLSVEDPTLAELVKLRLFAGFSVTEAGKLLRMPRHVAYENWKYIRTWMAANYAGEL